ncbi:fimbrillin family protein [Phocaeicola plebeius]
MNIRLPLHILSAATVLLFAATACTQDDLGGGTLPEGEYPLVIRATGLQAVATPASRATVDGNWQGVQTVALSVGGTVKEYDVTASDADGYKTATLSSDTDPFWWTSREDITVSAWWPYGTTIPDVVVKEDQSTKAGFEGSDFISAEAQTVQFDNPTLEFSHRTARITVLLKPGDGIPSVTGADVSVTGLGTDNGNPATIRTYAPGTDTYEALAAPQTVMANTPFIQVDLGRGTYYFRPKNDVVLEAGSRYTYTVNVTAKGLELAGCTIGGWTDGGGESGTAEDLGYFIQDDGSYTVYNANGLLAWNKAVQSDLSLNCTLTADINLTGTTWTPIGSGFSSNTGYQGTFDGQGHSITGLSITTNSTDGGNAVLFDGIGSNGTVKNLQVEVNYNVQQGVASGIVNVNYGTITACSVTGDIAARTSDIGGIASINNGSIIGCWFDGNLTTNYVEGGIAAYNYGTITACFYGGNAGQGVYSNQGETAETTKVDNSTVTWQTAVGGMNAALTGNAYQWTSGTDGLPVLKKK